jgi:hypothetical protein
MSIQKRKNVFDEDFWNILTGGKKNNLKANAQKIKIRGWRCGSVVCVGSSEALGSAPQHKNKKVALVILPVKLKLSQPQKRSITKTPTPYSFLF